MSRSYFHSTVHGFASSRGERWYKRFRAHRERARLRQMLIRGRYDDIDTELCPWDEWSTNRDGQVYSPDYFKGRVYPRDWHMAWRAMPKMFDPILASKRRSK